MGTADNLTITRILTQAAERGASDLHLTPGSQPVIRLDGKLVTLNQEAVITPEVASQLLDLFLTPDKQSILNQQKSVTVAYNLGNRVRFRVHVDFQKNIPAFDLRLVPLVIPSVSKLNLPKKLVEVAGQKEGLVLISGPFGSGRSTTLASLLDNINHTASKHIVTLEDPVEYQLIGDKSLVKQRDLGDDTPSLELALQDLRNEDVDVLGVDVPVPASQWPTLLQLATSGTLVLVVVEADATVRALEYLVNNCSPHSPVNVFSNLLSEALLLASCQRLLPRVGGGRVLTCELLLSTPAVQSLIRDDKVTQLQNVLDTSRADGMVSLDRLLADLVKTGEVQAEEAVSQSANKEALKSMLRLK